VRSGLFDILNIQGDLIVGRETLPIALGEEKALNLLLVINTFFGIFILLSTSIGIVSNLGLLLMICFLNSFIYLTAYQKGWMRDGSRLQAIAESNLLLPVLLALIWSAVAG
jgi:4-hydroxy-3-methylbut-2-enyl diphosphate reductase